MTIRRFAVAVFVVLAFSGMAAAQPAAPGPGNGPGGPPEDPGEDSPDDDEEDEAGEDEVPVNDSEEDEDELPEDMDDVNESDEDELNETQGPPEDVPGRSAQFDARLMTAINTLETLVDIAPSDEASSELEDALEILRGVQDSTDTRSLGPDAPEEDESETELNETEIDEEELNETEEAESETEEDSEVEESEEDQGQRQGRGPPGFVRGLLGGIFGR